MNPKIKNLTMAHLRYYKNSEHALFCDGLSVRCKQFNLCMKFEVDVECSRQSASKPVCDIYDDYFFYAIKIPLHFGT